MLPLQIGEAARQIRGRDPAQRGMPAKPVERRRHVRGKTDADGHVADRVFQDEVPADDPRDQLAHGGVGVGVGAAGDGDHGRQFGIAKSGEGANDGHQNQRERQRRACAGAAERRGVMHDVVRKRAVQNGCGIEFLTGDGRPYDGEDAGANDRADAEPGERPRPQRLLQPVFRLLRLGDQLVNGLACEELVRQGNAPGGMSPLDSNRNSGARASQTVSSPPFDFAQGRLRHGRFSSPQRHRGHRVFQNHFSFSVLPWLSLRLACRRFFRTAAEASVGLGSPAFCNAGALPPICTQLRSHPFSGAEHSLQQSRQV